MQARQGWTTGQSISLAEDSVQYLLILAMLHEKVGAVDEGLSCIAKALARMDVVIIINASKTR